MLINCASRSRVVLAPSALALFRVGGASIRARCIALSAIRISAAAGVQKAKDQRRHPRLASRADATTHKRHTSTIDRSRRTVQAHPQSPSVFMAERRARCHTLRSSVAMLNIESSGVQRRLIVAGEWWPSVAAADAGWAASGETGGFLGRRSFLGEVCRVKRREKQQQRARGSNGAARRKILYRRTGHSPDCVPQILGRLNTRRSLGGLPWRALLRATYSIVRDGAPRESQAFCSVASFAVPPHGPAEIASSCRLPSSRTRHIRPDVAIIATNLPWRHGCVLFTAERAAPWPTSTSASVYMSSASSSCS